MAETPADRGIASRCIVVGATARAFAESAARAGWLVHAADIFGDTDLRAVAAQARRVQRYPDEVPAAVADFPMAPVVWTGALENHPAVIEALARDRPLAGCSAAAIRGVRDPARLAPVVRAAGFAFPDTHASPAGLPTDGTFLAKPRASAGGRGIRPWRGPDAEAHRRDTLWQRFIVGRPWSAAWVACRSGAVLVGASRPLRGGDWCGSGRFAYCGSIDAPLSTLEARPRRMLEALGAALVRSFGLAGAFGCDMIVTADDTAHVVEVNPRPTASLELVERATGWSLAAAHLGTTTTAHDPSPPGIATRIWGKAIVFTPGSPRPDALARLLAAATTWTAADGLPAVADVPAADEPLVPHGPLVTVFACGATAADVAAELQARVLLLRRLATAAVSPPDAGACFPSPTRGRTA